MIYNLTDPAQAHALLSDLWPKIKASLSVGHRLTLEVKRETRTLDQNRLLWSLLTDVANQVDWYGQRLSSEDWKHMFTASLKKQRAVPGLDGGVVVLGQSTRKMTKEEMSELCELIMAFGAERNVRWSDEQQADR
jgi:hypothetical protein